MARDWIDYTTLGLGLAGFIAGSTSLWLHYYDKFVPPKVQIVGVLPVCVYFYQDADPLPGDGYGRGISFLLHIKNGPKQVFISGIDVEGKMVLSPSEFKSYMTNWHNKQPEFDIGKLYSEEKPYKLISWSGWPEDRGQNQNIKIEPHQERYVRLKVLDPQDGGQYSFQKEADFVVYKKNDKKEPNIDIQPRAWEFFVWDKEPYTYNNKPSKLRDDVYNGNIIISLRVGTQKIKIPATKIRPLIVIDRGSWDEDNNQKLYQRDIF